MKRFVTAVLLAGLLVPAAAFAEAPTTQDRSNASQTCRALRASMGEALFKQTYGTARTNRKNAFGRCVSHHARAEHANRSNARAACDAERNDPNFAASHDGKTFEQFYGTGRHGANAFGRCVSSKAKAARVEQRNATLNAARQCKAQRASMGVAAFRAEYGRNANDRNAFGKCVSKLAKAQND